MDEQAGERGKFDFRVAVVNGEKFMPIGEVVAMLYWCSNGQPAPIQAFAGDVAMKLMSATMTDKA